MIHDYFIKIGNKSYKLLPFDCPKVQDKIYLDYSNEKEPNGWKVVEQRSSQNDPLLWVEIAYIMLEDKSDFPEYKDFYEAVSKDKKTRQELMFVLQKAVYKRAAEFEEDKNAKKKIFHTGIIAGISLSVMVSLAMYFMGYLLISL